MTLEEVEALLGGPARDETRGATFIQYPPVTSVSFRRHQEWLGHECGVWIEFDDGRVYERRSAIRSFLKKRSCRNFVVTSAYSARSRQIRQRKRPTLIRPLA
jgi:hypothetical protein